MPRAVLHLLAGCTAAGGGRGSAALSRSSAARRPAPRRAATGAGAFYGPCRGAARLRPARRRFRLGDAAARVIGRDRGVVQEVAAAGGQGVLNLAVGGEGPVVGLVVEADAGEHADLEDPPEAVVQVPVGGLEGQQRSGGSGERAEVQERLAVIATADPVRPAGREAGRRGLAVGAADPDHRPAPQVQHASG